MGLRDADWRLCKTIHWNVWNRLLYVYLLLMNFSIVPYLALCLWFGMRTIARHLHWSPTVPISVWLPEPARDRGSKQETLNDDFYHTTSRGAAIFSVQTVLSYLGLTLNLWIGLCPMKWSSGVWSFGDVSVTYRSRNTMFRYRTSEVPVPNRKLW